MISKTINLIKKMKKISLLILISCLTFNLIAGIIDKDKAILVAKNFYIAQIDQLTGEISGSRKFEEIKVVSTTEITEKNINLIYLVNIEDGCIIVSACDAVMPVLGFSLKNGYSGKELPLGFSALLNWYKAQILYALENNLEKTDEVAHAWENYSGISSGVLKSANCEIWPKTFSKSPLTTTLWGQIGFYNEQCPYDETEEIYTYAGCTAVAMAQVMKFWNKPAHGSGSKSYQDSNNPPNSYNNNANFGTTTYNWANMPDIAGWGTSFEIAKLIHHCGVSINTDYGYNESSTGSISVIADALETYFGYSTSAEYIAKSNYSNDTWDNILKSNLDKRKPIVYRGDNGNGVGHSFVLDGYIKTIYEEYSLYTYYHVNWGANGNYNGYFALNDLTPASENYNYHQGAVVNVSHPDAVYSTPSQPSIITAACSGPYCTSNSYEFSISEIDLATEYEWVVTGYPCGASISNSLNYATVYAIFPSSNTIKVRAKNGGIAGPWRTYPFIVESCENKSSMSENSYLKINESKELRETHVQDCYNDIQIFPNPTKNNITINLNEAGFAIIQLINLNGAILKEFRSNDKLIDLNIEDLNNGVYLVKVISNQGCITKIIEIQK